ncbi:hypothetical protein GLOIN_2v1776328 [Rhizophagus clarus]|uniref:Uncharacterized protein n=1 Tax=Rhizophagus clarus TaxID=94130 RepID=A0A8H3L7N6_9GLOM|nr:hypothetical protein GLOIN_2v1776328 [Rhizophagus clarus]
MYYNPIRKNMKKGGRVALLSPDEIEKIYLAYAFKYSRGLNHYSYDSHECRKTVAYRLFNSAKLIQQTWRRYRMRPKSLASQIWEMVRNDGTPDDKKYLGMTSHVHYSLYDWAVEKKIQLWIRLCNETYKNVLKILYQRGYIIIRGSDWSNQLKWLQNPDYYRIDKDNIEYLIRVTECEKYKDNAWSIKSICERGVAKVEALLLQESFDTLCGASVVYLTIEDNILPPYDKVREIVDRAVNSSLAKLTDLGRRTKVLEILPQVESGYISVRGLKALKVLNIDRELPLDHTQEEIEENLNMLKSKLEHPTTEADINLYGSLKQSLAGIESSDLTWRDPEASMVLSDNSDIVKNLGIVAKCVNFVEVFNNTKNARSMKNILHNKKWKESETDLVKITERILGIISEIWSNPAFMTSTSRSEQSEGTYIADVIIPLLRTSLSDLPNGTICLSTAERQSLASKARRNLGINEERMGKKPDVMGLLKQNEKIIELMYTESSRIICSKSKKEDDDVKLWRETLDGASFVSALCRPAGNQFGIVGIQVAGTTMYLNILVNDLAGIPRYFHLDHAEIPLSPHQSRLKSLIRLLLTLRNVMIVNKSLLVQALDQATSHPPRNVNPSPTVSTPPYNK